jgi:hypothetical protein
MIRYSSAHFSSERTMPTLGQAYLSGAISASETPCVSIYQPTHRSHPDNAQDPIRFKNLVKQVEESLGKAHAVRDVRAMMEPLNRLAEDGKFWNHTLDGLAVLASSTRFDVFKVSRPLPENVVVADSFHIKPLLRYTQSADRFHVLALAENRFAVYEGNRYALDQAETPMLAPVPRPTAKLDPEAQVVERSGEEGYYREVDQYVADEISKPSQAPLLLACLPENMHPFRTVAKNPLLLAETLPGDPFAVNADALRASAWKVIEPHYLARLAKLSEAFGLAASRQQGTADLSDAARAAVASRVATLLIEADRTQPGKIDAQTGAIQADELSNPTVDDKLDDLAEIVLRKGGEVVVVPKDRMPTSSGLAAIFRF